MLKETDFKVAKNGGLGGFEIETNLKNDFSACAGRRRYEGAAFAPKSDETFTGVGRANWSR